MGNLCECYYPDDYYRWFKENELTNAERDNLDAQTGSRPECYHRGCILSGIYNPTETGHPCPTVVNCRNEITNNK